MVFFVSPLSLAVTLFFVARTALLRVEGPGLLRTSNPMSKVPRLCQVICPRPLILCPRFPACVKSYVQGSPSAPNHMSKTVCAKSHSKEC